MNRWIKTGFRITLMLFCIVIFVSTATPSAAAPSISNVNVWVNGDNAGENGAYYISFTNGDTPIVAANGDSISIQFPTGTLFSKTTVQNGALRLNNTPLVGGSVTFDQNSLMINIVVSEDIDADAYTLIEVTPSAGVYNPITVGSYQVNVGITISSVTTTATSNSYLIRGSQITAPTLSLTNTGTDKSSDYTVQFKGSLVENDIIYLHFPKGFTYRPTSQLANSIQINDKSAKSVAVKNFLVGTSREGVLLEITVPNGISTFTNKDVNISIKATNNLINPSAEADYQIYAYTSRDVVPRISNAVSIRNQVSAPTVQLTPSTVRTAGEYRLQFKTNGAVSGPNGYIEAIFPSDTNIPATISNGNVLINDYIARSVERDKSNTRTVRIYLPDNRSLSAGEQVTLVISSKANIANPSNNGTYMIQLRTSTDLSYVNSTMYSVTGGAITYPPPTQPGPTPGQGASSGLKITSNAPNAPSRYDITYRTSATGSLKGGEDEVTILFVDTAQVPEFIDREHIKINSVSLDTGMVKINNNMITFRLPTRVNIAGNTSFTITIDEKAFIRHPQVAGFYSLFVMTTRDGTKTYTYDVQGQSSFSFFIDPIYNAQHQITSYNMTLKNHRNILLFGGEDWIELTLPRTVTKKQLQDNVALYVNGHPIDMQLAQYSANRITFFVPKGVNIPINSDISLLLTDPNRILTSTLGSTVTFKIKTSKDTIETESNTIAVIATPGTTQPAPTTPNTNPPGTGTQSPPPSTDPTKIEIKLFLNKVETYVNNQRSMDLLAAPYIHPQKDGNTMVPLRFISEALGAKVDYKPEGMKIAITYNEKYMVLTVGSDIALRQGGGVRLPVPVEAKMDGITFVPVRFISEWMGFTVDYNATDQSIILQKLIR